MIYTKPIRVILIDDHCFIHDAVSTILGRADGVELTAQGSNGEEAVLLCRELLPDVVLMDVVMPKMNGVTATRTIRHQFPQIKILALSGFQDYESVHAMLESGASGYVIKGALRRDLISGIRATFEGQTLFSPEVTNQLLYFKSVEAVNPFELTARELQVLRLMAQGMTNAEISQHLVISGSTVRFHLIQILKKMGVKTRSEALVLAAKGGLL